MKNNSAADYAAYILLRTAGPLVRLFHPVAAFQIGRLIGEIVCAFDVRHRSRAYANLKTAFGGRRTPLQLRRLTLECYRRFGQNLIEVFMIPKIDERYAKKYVTIEGLQNLREAFDRGKGVIFVSVHEGSWELSNILASYLHIPFSMFVRELNMPRVNGLLNGYRRAKGCRIIRREDQTRELIRLIRANESCGMTVDQGGRHGIGVRFFNKDASMSAGAVRLALKYDAALVPVFSTRINGPYIKVMIEPAVRLTRTGDGDADIRENLQDLVWIFQKYLYRYPQEYLWYYRIWKYSLSRDIVILSDEKTGHLRQSQALARLVGEYLKEKGFEARVHEIPVRVKNAAYRMLLAAGGMSACRFFCQGCMACLRRALTQESYSRLTEVRGDVIISCGSSLAAVNRITAIENQAKSIVIMKPGRMPPGLFDLAVIARHDDPPSGRNIVVTRGALNLIDRRYLSEQGQKLMEHIGKPSLPAPVIGLLLGGDAKRFRLTGALVRAVAEQVSAAGSRLNGTLLVSTSRRTPAEAQALIKEVFGQNTRCSFLVIANERNFDFSVGGILDRSDVVVISPESISMVSEAASSGKYVVVFDAPGLSRKHRAMLADFEREGFVRRADPGGLTRVISDIWRAQPARSCLDNSGQVIEGLRKIL